MLIECIGTKTYKGCGEFKMEDEFSNSNKKMCRKCEGIRRRAKYEEKTNNPDDAFYKSVICRPWV